MLTTLTDEGRHRAAMFVGMAPSDSHDLDKWYGEEVWRLKSDNVVLLLMPTSIMAS
jgi:hypothetical protein